MQDTLGNVFSASGRPTRNQALGEAFCLHEFGARVTHSC